MVPFCGIANASRGKGERYSKERPTLQQGTADATARKIERYSKERKIPTCGISGRLTWGFLLSLAKYFLAAFYIDAFLRRRVQLLAAEVVPIIVEH